MNKQEFIIVKKAYLELLDLIIDARKNALGKVGVFSIPKKLITKEIKQHFTDFLEQLEMDKIIQKHAFSGKEVLTNPIKSKLQFYNSKTYEEIEDYKYTLWAPGEYHLTIEVKSNIITVKRMGKYKTNFTNIQHRIFEILYNNRGKEVVTSVFQEIIPRDREVKSYISAIRKKFIDILHFSSSEVDNILPRHKQGCYVLKI